jgi:hypothetical protein
MATMTNREIVKYILDYTMDWSIRQFEQVPDKYVWVPPRDDLNAPGWIMGHVAVTERCHVGMFVEGVEDIPREWLRVFRIHRRPSAEDLLSVAAPKRELVSYWRQVRQQTHDYLDRITDEDLQRTPENGLQPPGHDHADTTVLQWMTMTIQHQNEHRGQLDIIGRLIVDGGVRY